ncbi:MULTISPECIES: L-threonylcarbamoyladenylate synthase [Paenarthrobacter]|uniref:L-threonylcarbamoyladenylate synthase n=1 Tax=Paenarthrobacter TaxID=1742992 RepID=UPI00035D5F26|nr:MULTISPECIES: L-threonylcarbamoyladenylate synthase [Paenarthrobacter]KIA72442.1 sua5/YciO/YrdC/YwlC family protein [Arthrobacter sp. MWB30]KQR06491.1 threonylcarbamoyl-AMP synthase [Arthrobacter sp. Leaf145]SKB31316.1 translation factor SUA5 [Arthrobacter sp. 31Cvi3.1E]BCW11242.1 threonylcarbamoyl-AMP synthase [Arthrobacter sp. NtRootA2]BCW15324.1 threonylcarbamoyl-AMP synthase [Arthrobacter sp. NtRootA4]BCW23659.1 threonylcarbamoyl-AMP synthase [Arthrobacter sp. NtRootC7]BCW27927.1 thre
MTTTYNCTSEDQRAEGLQHAQRAISEKKCIVMPTDTVYGIAADAFSPLAVTMLLASKGRSRQMPPPVLIPRVNALDGLATDVPADARALAQAFWPGGLTLILHAQPSLDWDLGDTKGTVALRMPDDHLALDLLSMTGPLAVSSANRTGQEAAQTASEARLQLAESVEVYLEGGFRPVKGTNAVPSTIVDATSTPFRVVRQGAIELERLREIVPSILGIGETVAAAEPEAPQEPTTEDVAEEPAPADETGEKPPVEASEEPASVKNAAQDAAPATAKSQAASENQPE